MIHVTTANVTDRKGAIEAFSLNKDSLSEVKTVLAHGGYSGQAFSTSVQTIT